MINKSNRVMTMAMMTVAPVMEETVTMKSSVTTRSRTARSKRQPGRLVKCCKHPPPKPPFDCPYSLHRLSPSDNPSQDQPGGQVADPIGNSSAGRRKQTEQSGLQPERKTDFSVLSDGISQFIVWHRQTRKVKNKYLGDAE